MLKKIIMVIKYWPYLRHVWQLPLQVEEWQRNMTNRVTVTYLKTLHWKIMTSIVNAILLFDVRCSAVNAYCADLIASCQVQYIWEHDSCLIEYIALLCSVSFDVRWSVRSGVLMKICSSMVAGSAWYVCAAWIGLWETRGCGMVISASWWKYCSMNLHLGDASSIVFCVSMVFCDQMVFCASMVFGAFALGMQHESG